MASIKQYRGTTWRAIIRRKGFPPVSKTFETKKAAEAWVASQEARMGVSGYDPLQLKAAKTLRVKDIFDRYIAEVAPAMKGRNGLNTIKRVTRDAKFMPLLLSKMTAQDVRQWRDDRVKEIQPQSVHRELNAMSAVFTHAIKEWNVGLFANPCHLVTRFKNADKPRNTRWKEADVALFLKTCHWTPDSVPKRGRDYVPWALLLALETAMREGEICLPLVSDFYPEEHRLFLRDTKNGDERNVPLTKKAIGYLTHLCKDKTKEEKIFPLVANTLCEYVLDVRRECSLEHLVFHDTRHTAATRMSKKLPNVLQLAAQTGHRSLKSLQRYYHPDPVDIASQLED